METPKPKPVARPSIRLTVKSGKDTRGPGGSHHQKPAPNRKKQNQRQKNTKPQEKLVTYHTSSAFCMYDLIEASNPSKATEIFVQRHDHAPDSVEIAKFHKYLVEDCDGEILEVSAVNQLHAKDLWVKQTDGLMPVSIKKKPFTPKEHLTDRPFANLRDLMKEAK